MIVIYIKLTISFFKADFVAIMKNLPVEVSDQDIEEMFEFADKNKDGKLSYKEFKVCVDIILSTF